MATTNTGICSFLETYFGSTVKYASASSKSSEFAFSSTRKDNMICGLLFLLLPQVVEMLFIK